MGDADFRESARKFFVRVWFGLAKEWDAWEPRFELRYGGDQVVSDARPSASPRSRAAPDLIIDLDDAAADALARADYGELLERASMQGRASYAQLLVSGLRATAARPPDMAGLPTPRERRALVADLLARIRKETVSGTDRVEAMLRMWSFEEDFATKADRLSDFVVPGVEAQPWLDPSELELTTAASSMLDALIGESRPLADGAIRLPDYDRDEDPWNGAAVEWGRGTLFGGGRARADALASFPAASRLLAEPRRIVNMAFLTLAPGSRIPRHVDGFPLFVSWHLGLHVPPSCGIEVAGQAKEHSCGGVLAFDDSFLHSAWNASDRTRVLLSAWLLHPDFSAAEAQALTLVQSVLGWGS